MPGQSCLSGTCTCAPGRTQCSAACLDTATDPRHCGACDHPCAATTPGAVARCEAGRCVRVACAAHHDDCDGDMANGCEADLRTSATHCGACNAPCALAHATSACVAGECTLAACEAAYGDCNRDPADGCETALAANVDHCGACGRACHLSAYGTAVCSAGRCGVACNAGRGDCDGEPGNGCETDLVASVAHCGACGRACVTPNSTPRCTERGCAVRACREGFGDCDGDAANGCEVRLTDDPRHCGRCGNACRAGTCGAGACVPEQRSCLAPGTPGCGVVEIEGETFAMGPYFAEQRGISVSAFGMDAHEVTVARFRAFWRARAADGGASIRSRPVTYPSGRTIAWAGSATEPTQEASSFSRYNWTTAPGMREAHPVNGVGWWTALEFCAWDGGRLPTEAEWEYVARGRAVPAEGLVAGRTYPWGNAAPTRGPCDRAQWGDCAGDDGARTRRAGSFAATGGLFDLAGNVEEWAADDEASGPYYGPPCWNGDPQRDPLCAVAITYRAAFRGGSYRTPNGYLDAVRRSGAGRTDAQDNLGFRCVRSR